MSDPYTPSAPSAPSFPWDLVKDGEVYNFNSIMKSATAGKGLFKLCADGIAYLQDQLEGATNGIVGKLAKQTASSGDTLIGVLTYVGTSFTIPTGTLRAALQYIANNAASKARVDTITGGATGASITRVSDAVSVPVTPADWTSIAGDGDWITAVATATDLVLPLLEGALPHDSRLTGVSVSITPAVHASLVGLTMPSIKLYSISLAGVPTQIGATTSDTSLLAAYNANHTISIAGLSTDIDRSANRYVIVFTSESAGANALAGCGVYGATATHAAL